MSSSSTLRRRLMLAFTSITLMVAILFGAFALLLTYAVEDQFFSDALQHEAAAQQEHRARTGQWMATRSGYMTVYAEPASLPTDLRERFNSDPARSEYAGDGGRHYHLLRLVPESPGSADAFLVAEVSKQLVVRHMRDEILRWLAVIALLVVAVALLVGNGLARQMAAPLAALSRHVEAMRPDEPPRSFVTEFSTCEIEVLAHGLESLATRVHAFVQREKEFTRDASHELRTPLTVIHSACERLAHETRLSAEARRQVEFLRQSVWQLQQTVTALLVLAREENASLPAESVVLLPLLEQVIVEQAILLLGKPVEVVVDVAADARLILPPMVLRIVLVNLIGNAFTHTVAGFVRVDFNLGCLRVTNSDRIDETIADALHQPFVKGEASSGCGLGLAIVDRLCDRHGIELQIESDVHSTRVSIRPRQGQR